MANNSITLNIPGIDIHTAIEEVFNRRQVAETRRIKQFIIKQLIINLGS